MLQTPTIKSDPSTAAAAAATASSKDKDSAAQSLEANFSTYFSQMVASMPSLQASLPAPAAPAGDKPAPSASSVNKPSRTSTGSSPTPAPATAGAAQATATADATQAAAGAQASATAGQSAPQASAAASADGQTQAAAPPAGNAPAAAATPGAATAATAAAGSPASTQTKAAATSAAIASAAIPAPAADSQSGTGAKDTPGQATAGGRLQIQIESDAAPVTTKAPLTELASQIPMDTGSSAGASAAADKASLAAAALPAQAAAPAAVPDVAAVLQALQAPQLAGQTALLAMPVSESAAGTGLAGTAVAAAQGVSAGAQPGASGSVRVTASAAGDGAPATKQQSLLSQVDGTIKFLVKNQDQSAELQLHPESLGRVQINLKVEGNVVHAKVWASESAAVPVLQDHRSFLEASLKQQGLTLGSFDLQQGHRQQQAPMPESTPAAAAPVSGSALSATGQESPAALPSPAYKTSRIEYVA